MKMYKKLKKIRHKIWILILLNRNGRPRMSTNAHEVCRNRTTRQKRFGFEGIPERLSLNHVENHSETTLRCHRTGLSCIIYECFQTKCMSLSGWVSECMPLHAAIFPHSSSYLCQVYKSHTRRTFPTFRQQFGGLLRIPCGSAMMTDAPNIFPTP